MNKKVLVILLIIIGIFIPIIAKADEDTVDTLSESADATLEQPTSDEDSDLELEDVAIPEGPENGDLKCPDEARENVTCIEKIVNDKVVETSITVKDGDFSVTKFVRKTTTIGEYEVQFLVKGRAEEIEKKTEEAYVALILDASGTMSGNYKFAISAAKAFAQKLVDASDDIYISCYKFNANYTLLRDFSNSNLDNVNFGSTSKRSYIYKPLNDVIKKFSQPQYAEKLKYVVVFGDGHYFKRAPKANMDAAHQIRNSVGADVYTIGFGNNRLLHWTTFMRDDLSNHPDDYIYVKSDEDEYITAFQTIAGKITTNINSRTGNVLAKVIDNVGEKFYSEKGTVVKQSVNDINIDGVWTDNFIIKYDPGVNVDLGGHWYPTNDGFSTEFSTKAGKINLNSNINPLVYWGGETKKSEEKIKSCSGVVSKNLKEDNTESPYFKILCEQGYIKNGKTYQGLMADLKVDHLNPGENKFDATFGFEVDASLNVNLKCTYSFYKDLYNKKLQQIDINKSKATDEYELARLEKEKYTLNRQKEQFDNRVANDFNSYNIKFANVDVVMTVKVGDKSDAISLINKKDVVSHSSCQTTTSGGIENTICYMDANRELYLNNNCIDINSATVTNCDNKEKALGGNHKYYPELSDIDGHISIKIKNLTAVDVTDISLDDCSFYTTRPSIESGSLIYRHIDLYDPFIQGSSYNSTNKRSIGKNYKNTKFDFTKIIKSDLWNDSNLFEYQYTLSKANVENIRQDTIDTTEKVNSYLGSDCYINDNHKYVCSFVREKTNDDLIDENFFSGISVK